MRVPLAFFVLLCVLPAHAWNGTGHRVCAAITYDHLTPKARARVDELLRHHPDYETLLTRDSPPDPEARARAAFLAAASWPDTIRGDKRFYDDTKADAQPTPPLPGFPDMKRHTNWHYINLPYSPEGVPAHVEPPPTALSEIERILGKEIEPYDLPWMLHMEEDVHQPLHTVSRFLKSQPMGDQGGNVVYIAPEGVPSGGRLYRTLHAMWDDLAGSDQSDAYVTRTAAEISAEYVAAFGPHPKTTKDPKKWVEEGLKLAKSAVYTFGPETGTKEMPLKLPGKYEENARRVARRQIAEAGFRMAAVLNEKFR
jgi:S1/P1 Nuclease